MTLYYYQHTLLYKICSIYKYLPFATEQSYILISNYKKDIYNRAIIYMSQGKAKQSQTPAQLNSKSIQPSQQEILKSKVRSRPPTDQNEKDQAKKKRKLLSFQDQLEQGSPQKTQKIKRADNADKTKKKLDLTKPNTKQNMEEGLKAQYLQKIQKLKDELFQLDFSYWDGPFVVKKLKRKKKQTVRNLIQYCRLELISNFQSLASQSANDLLMVIKDFIIPHKMTIADIEALQLKTLKGDLLLNFKNVKIKDVTLSVNMQGPVRIIEKAKYEKNISAYPFNTWRQMSID